MSYSESESTANEISLCLRVAATPEHMGAMVAITPADQNPDVSDDHQVFLPVWSEDRHHGKVVTAEDGTTRETYSATIYRQRRTGAESDDNGHCRH